MSAPAADESREARVKRLRMRSMRRGIKEMDLILVAYADARLADMDEDTLAHYDALLSENDQDLYQWVSGQMPPPEPLAAMIADIRAVALSASGGVGQRA
ncbi:succinate dehydrogenase assembly factor 2 [Marinovum sp.]|uniref:succinate dehydrogenase assembly factor 2 n=1 Tax=Marinovum sp. TaxID=2024839 RepID=UPI003A90F4C2